MAVIPKFTSEQKIGVPSFTSGPRVSGSRAGTENIARDAAAQKELISAVENAEDALVRVRDLRQVGEAHAVTAEKMNDVLSRAEADPDLDSQDKYLQEIDNVGADAAKLISGTLARENFLNDFRISSSAAKNNITDYYRKRNIKATQDILEYNRQQLINSFPSLDAAQQAAAVQTFKKQLIDSVGAGIHTKANIDLIWLETQKEILTGDARHKMALGDYAGVIGELKNPDGIYKNLPSADKDDLIASAEAMQKRVEKEAEVAERQRIDANEDAYTMRLINPQAKLPEEGEVLADMKAGNISPNFAEATVNLLRSSKAVDAKTNSSVFNKLVDNILDPKKKPEDIRLELLKENAKGTLTNTDLNLLYTFNQEVNKELLNDILAKQKPKGFLQQISFWSDEYAIDREETETAMFKDYLQRVKSGKQPEAALKETIASVQKKSIYEIGQILSTPKGTVKVIGYDSDGEPIIEQVK